MVRIHPSIAKLPNSAGVYFFVGAKKEVLYVGKATSLKDRVRSYFASDLVGTRGGHMVHMVEEAKRVEFRATDSALEALILEAHCIKELHPRYNTREKDDKSFNFLIITTHETFPRLLTVRGKDLASTLHFLTEHIHHLQKPLPVFGPFPHAGQFKEALKIIRHIFPYYDTKYPVEALIGKKDRKLRFNETIGIYPPFGTTKEAYARTIRHIILFMEGKKGNVMRDIERMMHAYAKKRLFEEAEQCKRQLFALAHIRDVSLIKRGTEEELAAGSQQSKVGSGRSAMRIEAYDVAHLQGESMVGVMTVVEGGEPQKEAYRTFTIRTVEKSNDTGALKELLERRFAHPEWDYPRLCVVDGGTAQLRVAERVLAKAGIDIPIVAVVKDEHHTPKKILGDAKSAELFVHEVLLANAEAHRFSLARHRMKMRKGRVV